MNVLEDTDRLAALEASGLLRKTVSERIQHLVYTAHVLLQADVAQLNVLTPDEQHTVAEWPRVPPRVMPVTDSGCLSVLLAEETVAVPDARDHPRMCVLPWTTAFRGYIGSVICYQEQAVGTLCALTVGPRRWSSVDKVTIESLTRLVSLSLEEEQDG